MDPLLNQETPTHFLELLYNAWSSPKSPASILLHIAEIKPLFPIDITCIKDFPFPIIYIVGIRKLGKRLHIRITTPSRSCLVQSRVLPAYRSSARCLCCCPIARVSLYALLTLKILISFCELVVIFSCKFFLEGFHK